MDNNVFALAPDEVEELTRKAKVRKLPRQAVVVSEGDRTDSLYIILSGRVKVFLARDEDSAGSRHLTLRTLGAGDYFGEMVLDEGPRSASVVTVQPSILAVVSRETFETFIASRPDFTLRLSDGKRVISEKLTQREIANRVGASRQMIGLILRDLSIGGYISVSGKEITINREPPKHW